LARFAMALYARFAMALYARFAIPFSCSAA
jgi:hypothetical protein